MILSTFNDTRRKIVDRLLEVAKKRTSPQTGYVHLFYDNPDSVHQDTIPVLENMYYALGLFHTRMSDSILEARSIIDKILSFEVGGNFPIYLHDYPHCKDRSTSIYMLPVIHYLVKDYRSVLGDSLYGKLQELSDRILIHAKKMHETKRLPFSSFVRWQGFTHQLEKMEPKSVVEWGEYLLAIHMSNPSWQEEEVKRAFSYYNIECRLFLDTESPIMQDGFAPRATFFDLLVALQTGNYSKAILSNEKLIFLSALAHPFPDIDVESVLDKRQQVSLWQKHTKQPFMLFWTEDDNLRSLAIECKGEIYSIKEEEGSIEFAVNYPLDLPEEETNAEFAIYVDGAIKTSLIVDQNRASTFSLHDVIELHTPSKILKISFHPQDEGGMFFGHLSRCNRPYQVKKDVFQAYDWKLGVRTISRPKQFSMNIRFCAFMK
ncbi:MAG: hypothetical protein FJZ57_03460 [Chlamydiae bacterium]|nr:hypothetical protein [Chlamydiota bacterium]